MITSSNRKRLSAHLMFCQFPFRTFFPVWSVILGSLSDLSHVHEQFSETLIALQKEVSEYHHAQKDRHKANVRLVNTNYSLSNTVSLGSAELDLIREVAALCTAQYMYDPMYTNIHKDLRV